MVKTRESWGSRIGLVLAAAGGAVGLGNFLRFPGVAAQNGGGAFMIPYFIAFLFLALPLSWLEWTMGRYGGRHGHGCAPGIFDAMGLRRHPALKYLGVFGITGAVGIFFYYLYVESWTLAYSVFALTGKYSGITSPNEMGAFLGSYLSGSGKYFHGHGPAYVCFLITFVSNFLIVYHGVNKGIERFCKFAMPSLFIMAILLIVRVFTLDAPIKPEWNINQALGYLWNPDFSVLKSGKVWLEAAGQVFFSTSVGIGALLTYATYIKSKDDALLSATSAAFLNEFAEVVLGASIVVPAAYIFFGPEGTSSAVSGGTFGLAFKTTPLIFNHMPGGAIAGFAWFFLLFISGITSAVSIMQPGIAFLEDEFRISRKHSIAALGIVAFLVSQAVIFGDCVVDELDFWFSSFGLPLFGCIEVLVFITVWGGDRGWAELNRNADIRLPKFARLIIYYFTPVFLLAILLGWLATDGWKTIILKKSVDGQLVDLYTPQQLPWVIGTRIFYFGFIALVCWLVNRAWKKNYRIGH